MFPRVSAFLFQAVVFLASLAISLNAQQSPATNPATLLRAQTQQRATWSKEWLDSNDQVYVAWGAWLARQDHRSTLIPQLIQKVREYRPLGESGSQIGERDRHDALLMVLDSLIALDAHLAAEDARRLYPEFAAQSVILLSRSSDDPQPALLDIFGIAKANWTWLAAGNILYKNRQPGFVELLLGRFTQHMAVSITDPGVGSGSGGGGSECSLGLGPPKSGWPPVGLYQLTQFPERIPDATVTFLVGGQTPVYFQRTEPGAYDNPPEGPGYCYDGDRDQYRADYLNKLVDLCYPQINLSPYPQVVIVWDGEADYKQQLMSAIDEQRTLYRRMIACLRENSRVLSPALAASFAPRLEVVIRDERSDRRPLPKVLQDDREIPIRAAFSKPLL
jgi:hypothetical protein